MSDGASGLLGPSGDPVSDPASGSRVTADAGSGSDPLPDGPAFRISIVLAVDPRLIPATLVTLLQADPVEGYRERIESARPEFEKTSEVTISAVAAQMRAKEGSDGRKIEAAATAIVEQQFMASVWDLAYHQVTGGHVALIFSAGFAPPEGFAGGRVAADFDVPRLWVTSRSITLGDRFGAWSVPVDRDTAMPTNVVLTTENFQPLRMRFAKVKV